uniref:Uncharacterized protein n=1 Tax=Panagrolaimus superbus TaxID=310955 RepID=A0A914Z5P6_9BILA
MVEDKSVLKNQDKINWEPYIAKTPTQQPEFLESYPNFDGRGVVIAIIDSCIDVSLPGLQKTSTGDPKIIDCFDLTGNGNVDTSKIKKLDNNNFLIGLTGRQLKVSLKLFKI